MLYAIPQIADGSTLGIERFKNFILVGIAEKLAKVSGGVK
jgi:hypothetical protein